MREARAEELQTFRPRSVNRCTTDKWRRLRRALQASLFSLPPCTAHSLFSRKREKREWGVQLNQPPAGLKSPRPQGRDPPPPHKIKMNFDYQKETDPIGSASFISDIQTPSRTWRPCPRPGCPSPPAAGRGRTPAASCRTTSGSRSPRS